MAGVVILLNVVGGATNQARGIADDFTKLIIAGDVSSAYEKYLDPALMREDSPEEFAAGVQSLELDGSCKPNFSSLNVSSDNGSNAADVAGTIDCDTKNVDLAYRFEGRDELKMVNIRLQAPALTSESSVAPRRPFTRRSSRAAARELLPLVRRS